MANLALEDKIDANLFNEAYIDNTIRSNTDGGYELTRKRFTRPQLRRFKIGWTDLSDADYSTLKTFYDSVETHSIFQFTHPTTAVVYNVRFESPIEPKYMGAGLFFRWNVNAILKEV